MRDATPPATGPTRRLVTVGALGAAAVALAGCGIRLEDDAPRVPLVPTRDPLDAEDAMVRLLAAVRAAAAAPYVTTDLLAPLLPPLHLRQATVLHDSLRQRGVPEAELATVTPTPSSTPSSSGPSATPTAASSASASMAPTSASTPSAAPRRTVAEVESSILAVGVGLAGADPELRPTLVSVLGQAHAAVGLATPPRAPGPAAGPAAPAGEPPPWSTPTVLVPLITATRRATFLLEVAAARSPLAVRTTWLHDITALQALAADLVDAAGEAAPPPDLGQTLPRQVTTPAEAATLATEAVATLLATTGAQLRTLTDADPDAAFGSVPGWLGTVAATAHRHGSRITALPGLA